MGSRGGGERWGCELWSCDVSKGKKGIGPNICEAPHLKRAEIVLATIPLPAGGSAKYRTGLGEFPLANDCQSRGSQWESRVMTELCALLGGVC